MRELTTKSKSPSQLNGAVILSEANLRSETSEQPRRNLYDDVTRQFRKAANLMELDPNIRNILATTAQWLNVRLVAEGASGPTNPDGDTIMQMRGIEVIPDILCNAGGVICAHGGLHRRALAIGDGLQRTGYLSVRTRLSYCR